MHIALCGPATLELLEPYLGSRPTRHLGYPFPLLPAIADSLMGLGHRVTIVSTSPDLAEAVDYHSDRLDLSLVPTRARARDRALDFFAAERRGIAGELRRVRPDIVHAHWTYEFALGALSADVAPVLVTAHDLPWTVLRSFRDPYRVIRWLMAWRARLSIRHLTAVSPYTAAGWRREMLYRRPITLIPNPMPQLPEATAPRSTHPVVLSVGDASPRKNVKSLIRAFGAVHDMVPESELRLVGPGLGADGELANWARGEGLDKRVAFIGPLDRGALADAYAAATVYCHPSIEETFGMVLIEALSAGLPIVAGARSGGVSWTLFDGRAGRLVDVRDPARLAGALLDAIRDPASTVARGFDVQAEIRARYSPEAVARKYLVEYERLLPERGDGSLA